jgi:hypothetical protein
MLQKHEERRTSVHSAEESSMRRVGTDRPQHWGSGQGAGLACLSRFFWLSGVGKEKGGFNREPLKEERRKEE